MPPPESDAILLREALRVLNQYSVTFPREVNLKSVREALEAFLVDDENPRLYRDVVWHICERIDIELYSRGDAFGLDPQERKLVESMTPSRDDGAYQELATAG